MKAKENPGGSISINSGGGGNNSSSKSRTIAAQRPAETITARLGGGASSTCKGMVGHKAKLNCEPCKVNETRIDRLGEFSAECAVERR